MDRYRFPDDYRARMPLDEYSDIEIVFLENRQNRVRKVCTAVLNGRVLAGICPGWEDGALVPWDDLELDLLICLTLGDENESVSSWQYHNDLFQTLQETRSTGSFAPTNSEPKRKRPADLKSVAKEILLAQSTAIERDSFKGFLARQLEVEILLPLLLHLVLTERAMSG